MAKSTSAGSGGAKKPPAPPSAKTAPSKPPLPITDPKIKTIAGKTLHDPSKVTEKQSQELAASVLAHIEPRGKKS